MTDQAFNFPLSSFQESAKNVGNKRNCLSAKVAPRVVSYCANSLIATAALGVNNGPGPDSSSPALRLHSYIPLLISAVNDGACSPYRDLQNACPAQGR